MKREKIYQQYLVFIEKLQIHHNDKQYALK